MKTKFIIAAAIIVSSFSFAQKDEIKTIEKALKNSDFATAKSATVAADGLMSNMDDKMKEKYLFLKSQAFFSNGNAKDSDMTTALETLEQLKSIQLSSGVTKHSSDALELKTEITKNLLSRASKAYEAKEFKSAAAKFNEVYRLSPSDTIYLYFAASSAVQGMDYKQSLEYYNELKDIGYDGSQMEYFAVNKELGIEEPFGDKGLRDAAVLSGKFEKPRSSKSESKRAEIVKNIALIYVSNNENDKAIAAMKDARDENPEDVGLILSEANVHLKMGNKEKFRSLIEEATKRDPNNAELQFNLGVLAAEANDVENARKYYNKAIALDPNYGDAQLNMAVLILEGEAAIIEEMNGLGTSAADDKRYDELRDKRSGLYAEAVPYLKRVLEINPKNIDAARTLMNMYSALGETDKYKEMQALVSELEAGN